MSRETFVEGLIHKVEKQTSKPVEFNGQTIVLRFPTLRERLDYVSRLREDMHDVVVSNAKGNKVEFEQRINPASDAKATLWAIVTLAQYESDGERVFTDEHYEILLNKKDTGLSKAFAEAVIEVLFENEKKDQS